MLIVSGFSAFVDWRKEREFVLRAQEERDGKLVSITIYNQSTSCASHIRYYFRNFYFIANRCNFDSNQIFVTRLDEKGEVSSKQLNPDKLQVGDIVNLKTGDVVPVDGICINSNQMMTNEAAMTGESDERRKEPLAICLSLREDALKDLETRKAAKDSHELPSPIILSGTSVENGSGDMIVTVVGKLSALGEIMDKLEE